MYRPNVIWAWPLAHRRDAASNGYSLRRPYIKTIRRIYRLLRRYGIPADTARDVLWSAMFTGRNGAEFVSYTEVER